MEANCPRCENAIHKKIGNYKYEESGLDNVYIENIQVYECQCGLSTASIFRMGYLNYLIGSTLVKKPAMLRGNEIRFLRKNICLSAKAFAKMLGVGKTTLSKWENDAQQHSEAFDRLIRTTYLIEKGINHQDQLAILRLLENIRLKDSEKDYVIIAEKVTNGYIVSYRLVIGSKAEETASVLVSSEKEYRTATFWEALVGDETHIKSELEFASPEVLLTATSSSFIIKEVHQDAT